MGLGGLGLGSPIVYLKGMRILMFQLSGYYYIIMSILLSYYRCIHICIYIYVYIVYIQTDLHIHTHTIIIIIIIPIGVIISPSGNDIYNILTIFSESLESN